MLRPHARDQHALFPLEELGGDLHDLSRCLAGAEDDLGKPLAQRAVRIHLGETQVRHGRRLEPPQHLVTADATGAELFEQFNRFRRGHGLTMPQGRTPVTPEVGPGLMTMMPEEPMTVLEEVPDDYDIDGQDDQRGDGMARTNAIRSALPH